MKNRKHIFSLLLALVLLLGILTGCGKSTAGTGSDAAGTSSNAAGSSDGAEVYDDRLAAIQKAGKLVVGIEGTYPPFTYHDGTTDELTGFDVEVARAVGEKLGVEVVFSEAAWDSLLAALDSGRIDTMINAVSISAEREEKYDFAGPYLYINRQIWVTGDNDEIQSVADLNGKKIATNTTNVYAEWYKAQGAEIVSIDTSGEAIALLLSGRVDFIGSTSIVINDYLSEHPEADIKCAFTIPDSDEPVGIPVQKGETRLAEAIDQALKELEEDGTLSALSIQYFGEDYTQPSAGQ